jgi:hypothetical protein
VKTVKAVTINVPNAQAAEGTASCGNGLLGAANINWLDARLQNVVIPSLASQGVGTTTFPIFLLHNFVEYVGTWFYYQSPSLGVNGWFSNKGTFRTFAAPCP